MCKVHSTNAQLTGYGVQITLGSGQRRRNMVFLVPYPSPCKEQGERFLKSGFFSKGPTSNGGVGLILLLCYWPAVGLYSVTLI